MNRRDAVKTLLVVLGSARAGAVGPAVSTLIGTGSPGFTDREVNNPYGVTIGPDRQLYFCDLDNQRIRRLDLETRQTITIAGDGQKAYRGDGGPAAAASLNMPHEIQFDSSGEPLHCRARQPRREARRRENGAHLHRCRHRRAGILRRRRPRRPRTAAPASQHCSRGERPAAHLRRRESPDSRVESVDRNHRDLRRDGGTTADAGWRPGEERAT